MARDFNYSKARRYEENDWDVEHVNGEIVDSPNSQFLTPGKEKLLGAVAENFGRIVDIASAIVEIERMDAQTDAYISELEEKRKMLAEEADAYVKIQNAKTNAVVSKVEIIRMMMQDYYNYGREGLSNEDFSKIMQQVISQMGVSDE
ncbi:MAG: hypothetical protein K6B28_07480 [Lachnospiraceae bacterium]|nr:hypothetical protein [Lachnospiraceae bacterium]